MSPHHMHALQCYTGALFAGECIFKVLLSLAVKKQDPPCRAPLVFH